MVQYTELPTDYNGLPITVGDRIGLVATYPGDPKLYRVDGVGTDRVYYTNENGVLTERPSQRVLLAIDSQADIDADAKKVHAYALREGDESRTTAMVEELLHRQRRLAENEFK